MSAFVWKKWCQEEVNEGKNLVVLNKDRQSLPAFMSGGTSAPLPLVLPGDYSDISFGILNNALFDGSHGKYILPEWSDFGDGLIFYEMGKLPEGCTFGKRTTFCRTDLSRCCNCDSGTMLRTVTSIGECCRFRGETIVLNVAAAHNNASITSVGEKSDFDYIRLQQGTIVMRKEGRIGKAVLMTNTTLWLLQDIKTGRIHMMPEALLTLAGNNTVVQEITATRKNEMNYAENPPVIELRRPDVVIDQKDKQVILKNLCAEALDDSL